jgi:hypothetical protein
MNARFELAAGSVVGRDHVAAGRNNQDAFCFWTGPGALLAVVADGCGSGRFSEVGARIGARLVVEALRRHAGRLGAWPADCMLEYVRLDVLESLRTLAAAMGGSLSQTVADYLLFTVVGAVVTEAEAFVFTLGDGVYAVNGEIQALTSPGNEPAYLGYALSGSTLADADSERLRFTVQRRLPTAAMKTLLVGSDGVGDLIAAAASRVPGRDEELGGLAQFWEDDRHFRNPANVGRRLTLANRDVQRVDWDGRRLEREHGLLPDDTTLAVMRRRT